MTTAAQLEICMRSIFASQQNVDKHQARTLTKQAVLEIVATNDKRALW